MVNLLKNPDFEDGWWRKTHTGQEFGEIFVPVEWTAFWKEGGTVPADPQNQDGYGRPEMHVINKEAPYLDPLRIFYGNSGVKLFTFYRVHHAGLYQKIQVGEGNICEFGGWAHAWSDQDDYPYESTLESESDKVNFTFNVGIDPFGGTDPYSENIVWGPDKHIYDVFESIPSVTTTSEADEITVFIRSDVKYPFKHCDAYLDNFFLIVKEMEPTPSPPEECNGLPRVQFQREYNLLPQNTSLDNFLSVMDEIYPKKSTIGFSADDAGIGALDFKTAVVWWFHTNDWVETEINAFFELYYPGTIIIHKKSFQLPPVGNEPPPIVHYSRNFVGLQHYQTAQDWDKYVRESHPIATKFFFGGDAVRGKQEEPRMLTIWRKFVTAATTGRMLDGNRYETSLELLDEYSAEIRTISNNTGMSETDIIDKIDVIESLNETIPSYNAQQIEKAVEFDLFFGNHTFKRFGKNIRSGLLNVAIGNPAEHEVELLVPCAQLSHDGKAILGYHGYWAANENQDYMDVYWAYHTGRFEEWDKVFTARGLYPTYYLGESGIVYSPDGSWLNPYSGWRQCGDFPNYIEQMQRANAKIAAWNVFNQGRCYGWTTFIYGHSGWPNYDFGHGDLLLLNEAMKKYA